MPPLCRAVRSASCLATIVHCDLPLALLQPVTTPRIGLSPPTMPCARPYPSRGKGVVMANAQAPRPSFQIQHVSLVVSDVERSLQFYEGVLGLHLVQRRAARFLEPRGAFEVILMQAGVVRLELIGPSYAVLAGDTRPRPH